MRLCELSRFGTTRSMLSGFSRKPRKMLANRSKKTSSSQEKSSMEYLCPKLAEHKGEKPRIKEDPPLIFHPDKELAPGLKTGYA